jgi:polysaccharide pyruvyl transferase WcaK-like protein
MNHASTSPRILLFGIEGVYNYGCEAIVRGTERLIHERWPSAQIVYASPRPEDDRRRLDGLPIEIVHRKQLRRYSLRNIGRKLLEKVGARWQPEFYATGVLDGVDAVLSIGGDLYTLARGGGYPKGLIRFGEAALERGIPYVLWGASVGPFRHVPVVERQMQPHLKRLSLIAAREAETLDYLREMGVAENVVACADPAFVVAPEIQHQTRKKTSPRIAVNFSPLSVAELGIDLCQAIQLHAVCLTVLVESLGCEILLVPHVVCPFHEADDDLRYLARVWRGLPPSVQRHAELLDTDPGFLGVKRELVKCDVVIAARMHCAVNALAAAIPTILLAYSQKAIGMSQYVYGTREWSIPLEEFEGETVLHAVRELLVRGEDISSALRKRAPAIQKDVRAAVHGLETVFDRRRGDCGGPPLLDLGTRLRATTLSRRSGG